MRTNSLHEDSFSGIIRALTRVFSDWECITRQTLEKNCLVLFDLAPLVPVDKRWGDLSEKWPVLWIVGSLREAWRLPFPYSMACRIPAIFCQLEAFMKIQNRKEETHRVRHMDISRWQTWILPAIWRHLPQEPPFGDEGRWNNWWQLPCNLETLNFLRKLNMSTVSSVFLIKLLWIPSTIILQFKQLL